MARCVYGILLALLLAVPAHAQSVAEFYKGKNVEIFVGYAASGGYDAAARVLARHIGKYIPGQPNVIVRNMPGAASVVAANHVNNVAPKDGTVIGIYADIMPVADLLKMPGVQFDPRTFGWIGSITSRGTPVLELRTDAPAKNFEEVKQKEVLIAAAGPDATSSYAFLMNEILGTKLKVLMGYSGGSADIDLAIERGEVHGRASADWSAMEATHPDWLKKNLVHPIVQLSMKADPNLKGVPLAIDLAKSEEDREVMELVLGTNQYFRSFSVPSGVPADRLAALRDAFAKTMKDPEFIADFTKVSPSGLDVSTPEQIETYVKRVYTFPPKVIERAAKFVSM
jgi:tripartite-type tricarboxylate transporter receptor subunit TctC